MDLLQNLPTKVQIESELGKRSFYEFLKIVWSEVSGGEEYIDGWHIKLICDYLQATTKSGNVVRNIIINIPTRHAKSTILSVFPAWVWTTKPTKTFLFSSYSESIASDSVKRCRSLVLSDLYQERWPLKLKIQQDILVENQKKGFMRAVGAGGSITGRGADWLICDDPINADDIHSEAFRTKTNRWYKDTWANRCRNPKTAVRVLIQQRLHTDDTTGMLLDGNVRYEHICLPALYEGKRFVSSIGLDDPRTEIGEPLWPDRYGKDEIEDSRLSMTEEGFYAQFQQRPSLISGNVFKKDWFENRVLSTDIVARFISIDSAGATSSNADYSAIVVGELTSESKLYIREVIRDRVAFPQLLELTKRVIEKYSYKLEAVIIENKSSGISLAQTFMQSADEDVASLIFPFNPGQKDKVSRAIQASMWCSNGSVLLPPHTETFVWLHDFENELFDFPSVKHDDMTDAFDMLIIYLENILSQGYRERLGVEK